MFCTTTTPFAIQDIAEILTRPLAQVENAWSILQPHFGTQLTFGFGRNVTAPNFFDVVAMGVVIKLVTKPCDVDELVQISICTADEVAVFLDAEDFPAEFDEAYRSEVKNHLTTFAYAPTTAEQYRLLARRKDDVVAAASEVLEQMNKILKGSHAKQPATCKVIHSAIDQIA